MKNRWKTLLFTCILACLTVISPEKERRWIFAAEPEGVSLSCNDAFFDPSTRTLSVEALLSDGQKAALIAASFFPDGHLKEKAVQKAEVSGTYSFPFTKTATIFKIFAVDPDTLSPLTKNLTKTREYTAQDLDVTTTVVTSLSMRTDNTAAVLCAMTADYLAAEKCLEDIKALTVEKVALSDNMVTKFQAVSGNETAYHEALATVSAADAAYASLETSAAALDSMTKNMDENLNGLARQAGLDVLDAKKDLSNIRALIDNKYYVDGPDDSQLAGLCDEIPDKARIGTGAGSGNLSKYNLLITGAGLAVAAGQERSAIILEPMNGKLYEDAGLSGSGAFEVYAARQASRMRLADLLKLEENAGSSFDQYAIATDGDYLKATVTSLSREGISKEELNAAGASYFDMQNLGDEKTWDQARSSFISTYRLSEDQLSSFSGAYLPTLTMYFSDSVYTDYAESHGYQVYDSSNYIAYNDETRRTRYTKDKDGNYVGYYEQWINDRKTMESYYSEDRRQGLNGLIYQKYWDAATGYLGSETMYTNVKPKVSEGPSGGEDFAGTSPEGEEAAGEIPETDGVFFRTEKNYWIRDDFGVTYNGQIQSEIVYQWRQDFVDEYVRREGPGSEINADQIGWFEILYRFYYPEGGVSSEKMAMQSATVLRERNYTEKGELREEKWYPFSDETFKFKSNHYTLCTWYTSNDLESPGMNLFSDEMKAAIKGHPQLLFNPDEGLDEYYTPGMWMVQRENNEDHTPIPGTIETIQGTVQFREWGSTDFYHNYLNPLKFDCEGWEKSTGDGGTSKSYHAVVTHYQEWDN